MKEIGAFTPEQARLLWQDYLSRHRGGSGTRRQVDEFRPRHRQVILKEDLFAAVDTKTDPSTAEAYTLMKKNGNLVNTGRTITIVNRFENISIDAGTYAKAEWIDGEWQLYAADCPGGSESSGSIDTNPNGSQLQSEGVPP
jgi:hypothetical protein